MKKLLAALLALALIFSLAACDSAPGGENSEDPAQSPSEPSVPSYVDEFTQTVAGVDADTVMFTVDGVDVTAEYYFYWLFYDCYRTDMSYQAYLTQPLDFDSEIEEGVTAAEYLKEDARKFASVYVLLEREAQAGGLGLTAEQQETLDQQKEEYIAQEGQEGFEKLLRQQGMSEEMFDRINAMSGFMVQNLLDSIAAPTEEELEAYCTENGILGAKHILIRTVVENEDGTIAYNRGGAPTNEDGTEYTGTAEEFNAAALEKVNDILAQINEAEDHEATFDELMNLYSEDPGLASYPDGYTFGPGQMVEPFEEGTKALTIGSYSAEPVKSDDGYHIILRTVPDVTDEAYRGQKLNERMDEWSNAEFTTTPAYDSLDVKSFYEKYTAYAESFYEEEEGGDSPAPSESGEPTESVSPSESPSESPEG